MLGAMYGLSDTSVTYEPTCTVFDCV
jgi:hypothetical protein